MGQDIQQRFWSKVQKSEGCWLWTGTKQGRGYGVVHLTRHWSRMAHRMAWILTYGPIPEGMLVCHRCDNPPCVNPDHLFLGTHQDNTDDMIAKGRQVRGGR